MTETVIAWSGFLGAWLLVAGPLYQGAVELLEQDQRAAAETSNRLPAPPPPPSAWWWLLPPFMLILRRRRSNRYRDDVLARLTPAERAQRAGFLHKAAGWFVVALGGTFIAIKEMGELVEHHEWSRMVLPTLVVAMLIAASSSTIYFIKRRRHDPSAQSAVTSPPRPGRPA
ncbi:hypothetical protein [Williamsia deligens]|uniref:Uncharacterized protein n=1 Tax=Williamsia deligens TaxID=321325 RepID=A0ABW3G4R8_9NOCA|nr:hypothetical protein [Williamsia deligens]MCP2193623.1 hypothetical protein [Williamsia deligens]